MQPSDRPVDPDADPTRVRPDRQAPADVPSDPDAAPTTVRPRFPAVDAGADATHDSAGVGSRTGADTGGSGSAGSDSGTGMDTGGWGSTAPDERYADDDRDGFPTADLSKSPRYPSHRAETRSPAQDWLAPAESADTGVHTGAAAAVLDAGPDADPDGAPTTVLTVAHDSERSHRRRDWAWVEEWRAERSAPAWGPGIALGIFVALLVAVALIVLTTGVSDSPVLAIVFNLVIAAGMAPALWLCRSLPVLRFLAAGAAAGILFGWIAMLTTF